MPPEDSQKRQKPASLSDPMAKVESMEIVCDES